MSTYEANNSLKLSFTLNCVLKRANDLKPFQIDSFAFMKGNRSWTRQRHNRDIINILLTSSSRSILCEEGHRFANVFLSMSVSKIMVSIKRMYFSDFDIVLFLLDWTARFAVVLFFGGAKKPSGPFWLVALWTKSNSKLIVQCVIFWKIFFDRLLRVRLT